MKPVKLSGADFKAWLESEWERPGHPDDDPMWDDVWVLVNGVGTDDPAIDQMPNAVPDDAEVVVETGVIVFNQNRQDSDTMQAVTHLRAWLKQRDTETLVISVNKAALDEVKAYLKQKGVKIV